jgi:hypothetical protein
VAQRGEDLNVRVSADTRQAVADIDKVADAVEELEDGEHVAEIAADTDDAERQIRTVDDRLDKLTTAERRVLLELQSRDAQRDIDKLNRELARAEKFGDTEIEMRLEARGNAQQRLDAIQSQIREIDGSTPDIKPDVDSSGVDELTAKLNNLPGVAGSAGAQLAGALRGPGAAAAALAVGLGAISQSASTAALAAGDLARLTGDSVEFASQLNAVWQRSGADVKDLQDVLLQMGGVLSDDAKLAADLGLNLNDGRSLGERFVQVVELLGQRFDDAGERSIVASRLFGEEGVRQVNAVVSRVGDLTDAIDAIEPPFSQSDVDLANEYKAQISDLTGEFKEIGYYLGTGLLPVLTEVVDKLGLAFSIPANLAEDAGRSIRSLFDGGAADRNRELVAAFAASEAAARSFDRALLDNVDSAEEARQAAIDYGLDLHAQNVIVAEWAAAQRDAALASGEVASAQQIIQAEIDRAIERFRRFGTDGVENMESVRDAAGETAVAISAVDQALADARGELDDREAWLNVTDQLDRVRESHKAIGDEANDTADEVADATRRHERDLLGLERSVLGLIERYDDIPPEKITQIRAQIAAGNIDEVERMLEDLTRDRYTRVVAEIAARTQSSFNSVTFRLGSTQPTIRQVDRTAQTVDARQQTFIYPQGTTPTQVKVDGEIYLQRNGPR